VELLAEPDAPDDLGFVTALIDHLIEEYTIMMSRIYVVGYSNGGAHDYRLRCELSEGWPVWR